MSRLAVWTAALAVWLLPCRLGNAQEVAARVESPAAQAAQASREALEAVLRQPTTFEFEETSLTDAIGFLADKNDVVIDFDLKALSNLSLDPSDASVSRTIRKPISLASALHMILGDFELTHVVRDDAILITSVSEAQETLTTRVYKVGDLLSGTGKGRATMDQLVESITGTVAPDLWTENGGSGTIAPLGDVLIVTQTRDRHREVGKLLAALRGASEGHGEANPAKPAEDEPAAAHAELAVDLWQPTEFEFADTALSDAVEFLAKKHDIEIQLDHKALSDLNLDASTTAVTLSIRKPTPLRSALERMLRPVDLAWLVRDEVIWITGTTEAEEWTTTRIYPVDDLLNRATGGNWSADDLVAAITTSIHPESWTEQGGPGAIARVGDMLVVAQNREGHEKLSHLLAQLRVASPKDAGQEARDANRGSAPTADEELKIVEYPLQFLSGDEAAKALTALLAPETWQTNGGAGAACTVVTTAKTDASPNRPPAQSQTILVVRQTPTVHKQIRRLLGKLDRGPNSGFGGGGVGGGGGGFF